jgi:dienelactone hydrolase
MTLLRQFFQHFSHLGTATSGDDTPPDLGRWRPAEWRDVTAPSIGDVLFPALRHEVSFWHGSDRLTGDLVLPGPSGRYPVLVVVGEPGHADRDYSAWLDGLAAAGIAGFTWDRGARRASAAPSWNPAADQAREVLAAIDRLRCLPEIDGSAVAVMGWGRGGLAAAQAATFSHRVRALILACAPTTPPSGSIPGADADPLPTLSALTVPVLALFGEQDPLVPLEAGVRGVRQALRDAGHADHELAVVRGADHALRVRPGHGLGAIQDGRHAYGDWPAGLTEMIANWLAERIRPLAAVPAFAPPSWSACSGPVEEAPAPTPPVPAAPVVPAVPGVPAGRHPAGVPVRQVRRRIAR